MLILVYWSLHTGFEWTRPQWDWTTACFLLLARSDGGAALGFCLQWDIPYKALSRFLSCSACVASPAVGVCPHDINQMNKLLAS